MSPSTAPPSCSLTRTARTVPLTRPQTVTSCAMTLPSTCAPSPMRSSEARSSPLMRPKTCAGPLHSMLPTIDIPEPMQELGPAFVVGCRLGGGSSTTECCGCNALSTASAAWAAVSLSFSGALLLNMSTSVFRRHFTAEGQSCNLATERELRQSLLLPRREDPQVRTPFENRTAQSRTATTMEPTIASHSTYGAVSGISLPDDLRIGTSYAYSCCEEKLRQLCAAERKLPKKVVECSISITERSGACRPRSEPIARARRA